MKTIFISVQTGMVVRDLLRCGPLERILEHPDAHVVLLTPGVRDPAFVGEFGGDRVSIVPQQPYAPSTMVWRLIGRRWRHAQSAGMADAMHRLEERFISTPAAYDRLFREYQPALVVSGDPLRPGDANLIAAARRHGVPSLGSVRSWDNLQKHLRTRADALTVWNAINAREAVELDRYRPERVTQVGAPQLDVYFAGGTAHCFARADAGFTFQPATTDALHVETALSAAPHPAVESAPREAQSVYRAHTRPAEASAPGEDPLVDHGHKRPAEASAPGEDPLVDHAHKRPSGSGAPDAADLRDGRVGGKLDDSNRARVEARVSASTAESFGLDPSRKTLLLATSSFTYDSDQTYLVDMLLAAIRNGEIHQPLQIVLRLHPDDRVGRYLKYRHAPEVILDIPETYLATLGWTMTCSDLEHTRTLLKHADVMVNFATTLTLEAAITDTPTLLVAFSPIDPDEMQRYVVGLHFQMHYKALVERDLVPIAWDRDQVVSWINRYLDDPSLYRAQRTTIVREWVQFTDGQSGRRLGDTILRLAGLALPDKAEQDRLRETQCVS